MYKNREKDLSLLHFESFENKAKWGLMRFLLKSHLFPQIKRQTPRTFNAF